MTATADPITTLQFYPKRSALGLAAILGTEFDGLLHSDRYHVYLQVPAERRQICWAHLLRKFAWYAEQGGVATELGLGLLGYTRQLLHEWHRARDGCITRETFARNTRATRPSA